MPEQRVHALPDSIDFFSGALIEPLACIASLTGAHGVDIVLECSGIGRAADDALKVIRKQGQLTQIGLFGKPITIDFEKICYKELKVTGTLGSRWVSWKKAIQLVESNKVKLVPLISHQFKITEWKDAFELFENKGGVKLVLLPVDD